MDKLKTMNKEIRSNNQLTSNNRTVQGYAVMFNCESEDLGFIEIIHQEAITEETIANSDVFARFNHNDDKILARSKYGKGSLSLKLDDNGLFYSFEAPNTALGDELLEYIKRGDISQSSFAFSVSQEQGSEKWTQKNGQLYRHIYKIDKLFDIAPVFQPAYSETTCSARALNFKKNIEELNEILDDLETEIELM